VLARTAPKRPDHAADGSEPAGTLRAAHTPASVAARPTPMACASSSFEQGDELVCTWQPQKMHEAFPGMLERRHHRGSLLDCHCNWTAAYPPDEDARPESQPPCTVTAEYAIKLRRPTPTERPGVRCAPRSSNRPAIAPVSPARWRPVAASARRAKACSSRSRKVIPRFYRWRGKRLVTTAGLASGHRATPRLRAPDVFGTASREGAAAVIPLHRGAED
jgi:hypothetical protein